MCAGVRTAAVLSGDRVPHGSAPVRGGEPPCGARGAEGLPGTQNTGARAPGNRREPVRPVRWPRLCKLRGGAGGRSPPPPRQPRAPPGSPTQPPSLPGSTSRLAEGPTLGTMAGAELERTCEQWPPSPPCPASFRPLPAGAAAGAEGTGARTAVPSQAGAVPSPGARPGAPHTAAVPEARGPLPPALPLALPSWRPGTGGLTGGVVAFKNSPPPFFF